MCIQLKPPFSRHKGIGVQFTDEPTGNLDQQSGRDVLRLLKMMNEEWGQTILLVTHDMEIAQNADRIIEIQDGRIARIGEGAL